MPVSKLSGQAPANHVTLPPVQIQKADQQQQSRGAQATWSGDTHLEVKEDDGKVSTLRRFARATLRRKSHEHSPPKPQPQSQPISATRVEVLKQKEASLKAAQNALNACQTGSSVQVRVSEKISTQSQQVAADLQSLNPSAQANEDHYKDAKSLKADLKSDIADVLKFEQGLDKEAADKAAKKAFNEGYTQVMNSKDWNIIEEKFTINGKEYTSRLIPAGQMRFEGASNDIYKINYNGKGTCSGSTKETQHIPNLWISELVDENGTVLFRGLRHGVISPYGLKEGSMERTIGADNRAKEVLTAALFTDQDKFDRALQGETVPLRLTSVSLVTASNIGGLNDEGAMFNDQLTAWQNNSGKDIELTVTNRQGEKQNIKIHPEVLPFSVGVNNIALSTHMDFVTGWSSSDQVNKAGLKTLMGDLGKGKEIGGWVGEYLATNPENAETVTQLVGQIRDIWANKSHHTDGGDPYKLAVRIAYLTAEIGASPAWNCKSGKDRTGWMDVELKAARIMTQQNNKVPTPGPLDDAGKAVLDTVSTKDGNLKVQEDNTAVKGNKIFNKVPVMPELSIHNRVSGPEVVDQIKGISGLYGS